MAREYLDIVPASTILKTNVKWLVPGILPLGKLVLLAGDPGVGKSLLATDLVAGLSVGRLFFDAGKSRPCHSIWISDEESHGDTVVPRLEEAGADTTMVYVLRGVANSDGKYRESAPIDLKQHADLVREYLGRTESINTDLVVIDPITGHLGNVDAHNEAEVRTGLIELAGIAEETETTILALIHRNKSEAKPSVHRVLGSVAFTAVPRVVWNVSRDKEDPGGPRRLLTALKNNLNSDGVGYALSIEDGPGGHPMIVWESERLYGVAADMDEGQRSTPTAREEAKKWLGSVLEGGERPGTEVCADGRKNGHSYSTLQRARGEMGVTVRWEGRISMWALPDSEQLGQLPNPEG